MSKENTPSQDGSKKKRTKKTKAKRLGLKSLLSYRGRLAATSFGKGNDAKVELKCDGKGKELGDMPYKSESGALTFKQIDSQVDVIGHCNFESIITNPTENPGEDYLRLKGTLEKIVFGTEFPGDNVRIQIIHNILDIQKIIGLYINDVIYCVNNMQEVPEGNLKDFVAGYMDSNTKVKKILEEMTPFFGFFGDAFQTSESKNANTTESPEFQNNATALRIVGAMRQLTAHYWDGDKEKEKQSLFFGSKELKEMLRHENYKYIVNWDILDTNYRKRIDTINANFMKHSAVNLLLIWEVLGISDDAHKKEIAEEYYCFSIRKDDKNLGVNMKKLREMMIDAHLKDIKDKRHDSYRAKLYTVIDYLLFRWMNAPQQKPMLGDMVDKLRTCEGGKKPEAHKDGKESHYADFAGDAWEAQKNSINKLMRLFAKGYNVLDMEKILKNIVNAHFREIEKKDKTTPYWNGFCESAQRLLFDWISAEKQHETLKNWSGKLLQRMNGKEKNELYYSIAQAAWQSLGSELTQLQKKLKRGESVPVSKSLIDDVKLSAADAFPLVQILSFLCNFMDGKEINELLTAYIHKFENIQSFIDTLKELDEEVKFGAFYALFNEKDGNAAGEIAEQLRVLASIGKMKPDMGNAKLVLYKAAIEILGVKAETLTDDWFKQLLTVDKPFRNFLANNVIESRRFTYLVRYTKPESVRKLMENRKIIRYVLTRIPELQVDSYYKNISDVVTGVTREEKIDALADKLKKFSFDTLEKNRADIIKKPKPGAKEAIEIERLKALTGLYLTVAYVAIKNLVKANARYYIAFAIFERDEKLFERKLGKQALETYHLPFTYIKDDKEKEGINTYFALTEHLIAEDKKVYYTSDPAKTVEENKLACRAYFDAKENHRKKNRQHYTRRWRTLLEGNIDQAKAISATGLLLTKVRNHAEHLNVLRDLPKFVEQFREHNDVEMQSYFELYHFLMQKMLIDLEADPDNKKLNLTSYVANIEKFGTPSHDLIKIAYVSLAYNLARYKNLTIDALFDKDNESAKKNDEKEEKPS